MRLKTRTSRGSETDSHAAVRKNHRRVSSDEYTDMPMKTGASSTTWGMTGEAKMAYWTGITRNILHCLHYDSCIRQNTERWNCITSRSNLFMRTFFPLLFLLPLFHAPHVAAMLHSDKQGSADRNDVRSPKEPRVYLRTQPIIPPHEDIR